MRTLRSPKPMQSVERARAALDRAVLAVDSRILALEHACLAAAHEGYSTREISPVAKWSPTTVSRACRAAERRQERAA